MIALGLLAIVGAALLTVLLMTTILAGIFRVVLWLVFLPFRILFGLLFLPILLIKLVLGGVLFLIVGPVLAILAVIVMLAVGAAVAIPLAPILALAFLVWLLMRSTRHGALVVR